MPATQDRLIALTYLAGAVVLVADTHGRQHKCEVLQQLAAKAKAALALPAPTAPKLLSHEQTTVQHFVGLSKGEREALLARLRREVITSGPLLRVLEYLMPL